MMAFALAVTFVSAEENDIMGDIDRLEKRFDEIMELLGGTTTPTNGEETEETTETTVSITGIPETFTFTQNLRQGARGMDVKYLQILLNADPDTRVSAAGAGSPGMETEFFGPATLAAVKKFQTKYSSEVLAPVGLTTATGFVGTQTRAKLNALLAGGVVAPGVPAEDDKLAEILEMLKELGEEVKALRDKVEGIDPRVIKGEEGELTLELSPDVYGAEVRPNRKNVEVAEFYFEANEDSDLVVQRATVTFRNATLSNTILRSLISSVSLWHDGTEVGRVNLTRDNVREETAGILYSVTFTGLDIEIEADDYEAVVIAVDAADFAVGDVANITGTALGVGFTKTDAVRAIDGANIYQYAETLAVDEQTFDFDATTVTDEIEISDNTPEEGVVIIGEKTRTDNVTLGVWNFTAEDGFAEIDEVRINLAQANVAGGLVSNAVRRAKLYIDGTYIGQKTGVDVDTPMVFDVNYFKVAQDQTVEIEIVADLYEKDGKIVNEGASITATLTRVVYLDEDEGTTTKNPGIVAETQHLYTGVPMFDVVSAAYGYVDSDTATTRTVQGANFVIELDITAVERDIYIRESDTTPTDFTDIGYVEPTGTAPVAGTPGLVIGMTSGDLTSNIGFDGLFEFISAATTYDIVTFGTVDYFRIKKGNTARMEIVGTFKSDLTTPDDFSSAGQSLISNLSRASVVNFEWGVRNIVGNDVDPVLWHGDFVKDLRTPRM